MSARHRLNSPAIFLSRAPPARAGRVAGFVAESGEANPNGELGCWQSQRPKRLWRRSGHGLSSPDTVHLAFQFEGRAR
jgi:hypothetical protein